MRLQKEYQSTLKDDSFATPKAPFVEEGRAIFEDIIFNKWSNNILFRRTIISPEEFSVKSWAIVIGPRHVDWSETQKPNSAFFNAPSQSPEMLESNRQDYATQQKFRTFVGETIPAVAPKALPGNWNGIGN